MQGFSFAALSLDRHRSGNRADSLSPHAEELCFTQKGILTMLHPPLKTAKRPNLLRALRSMQKEHMWK